MEDKFNKENWETERKTPKQLKKIAKKIEKLADIKIGKIQSFEEHYELLYSVKFVFPLDYKIPEKDLKVGELYAYKDEKKLNKSIEKVCEDIKKLKS